MKTVKGVVYDGYKIRLLEDVRPGEYCLILYLACPTCEGKGFVDRKERTKKRE